MIGRHYVKSEYNCAHFISDWYSEKLNIHIPVVNEFDRSFVVWMRKNFTQINKPENHCLVLMTNLDDSMHVGVYYDYGVFHNFKPSVGKGSVCKHMLGSLSHYYKKVSFYKWSE